MLPTFVSHLDTLWRAMDGQWLDYDGGGTIAKKSEGDDGLMLLAHRETQIRLQISQNCTQLLNRSVGDADLENRDKCCQLL